MQKARGKNLIFRICWSKPANLQVNWVSSLGQTGSSCWLNSELASHQCKTSPSFTKASTFIGQMCNFVHLFCSSCLIFKSGDKTAPAGPCFDCIHRTTKPFIVVMWSRICASHRDQFTLPASPEVWQDCGGTVCVPVNP